MLVNSKILDLTLVQTSEIVNPKQCIVNNNLFHRNISSVEIVYVFVYVFIIICKSNVPTERKKNPYLLSYRRGVPMEQKREHYKIPL